VKVGVLAGTFDPIHLGHLRAAETARDALDLDLIALVPSAVPPHRAMCVADALDRFAMACLACADQPDFVAWDTELVRSGTSYTVDTLAALVQERPGDELVLIVGSDTWPEMTGWREPERLFGLARVAVVDRPGRAADELVRPFPSARSVVRVEGPALPISATLVRERLGRGDSVRFLIPGAVLDYIVKKGLYA
jgi:nicotinate-nucleotide adenylyltransferase